MPTPANECTRGVDQFIGRVQFFEGMTVEGLKAGGFEYGKVPEAGDLLSTTKEPLFFGAGEGLDEHYVHADWNCCPKGHVEKTDLITK